MGSSRICDRIVDCLSAEDEIDCRLSMLNSEEDESKLVINEHYESNKPLDEIRIQNLITKSNRTVLPLSRQAWNNSDQSPMSLVEEPSLNVSRPNSSYNAGSSLNDELFIGKREIASYFTCQKYVLNFCSIFGN